MEKYYPPEGFVRDENSGMYYQKLIGVDESGTPIQYITWFNAETGEYSQHPYSDEPIPAEIDAEQTNVVCETEPLKYNERQSDATRVKQHRAGNVFSKKLLYGIGGVTATAVLCFGIWKSVPLIKEKIGGSAKVRTADTSADISASAKSEIAGTGANESDIHEFDTISLEDAKGETEKLLLALVPFLEADDYEGAAALMKTEPYTSLIQAINSGQLIYADTKESNNGIAAYSNGYFYYGTWEDGIRAGTGCFINAQTEGKIYNLYDGEWANDLPNGEGTIMIVKEPTPYEEGSNSTTADKTTVTGTFKDGLQNGEMKSIWYMNDGGIHEWSPIIAINGIYQEAEIPGEIAEREYIDENRAEGKKFVAYDINKPETDLWDDGYVNVVGGLEEIIGDPNEKKENNTDEPQNNNTNDISRWDGVYQGEGFTVVFASEAAPTENCTSEYHIVVDMGYDVFFPRTAALTDNNLIEDSTTRDDEIVTEFSFRLEGDTLQYHRLIHEDGYEDTITLKKTSENPLIYYEKYSN